MSHDPKTTHQKNPREFHYQTGFGNEFATEAIKGALPEGMNSPQKAPFGLYAEQLSGSAFTAVGRENQRSWLYRILPSVVHTAFKPISNGQLRSAPFNEVPPPPDQLRWDPPAWPDKPTDFIAGLITVAGNGDATARTGSAVHLYAFNQSMVDSCFYNADGDFLFVPQEGELHLQTEFGWLDIKPGEIAVIQRGIKFRVELTSAKARGYICEIYGEHFVLPNKGPIGANGLANTRDFLTPHAAYEEKVGAWKMTAKFQGQLWQNELQRSPFDVVAWHGNYAPYKYDLARFNTINTVSYDHPDPSIFTVLTSPTTQPGTANVDFVIFPPRWMVAEKTFRPPYYHRNVMSEYMGLIHGVYDAKTSGGFVPGGGSLHNCMSAHGPDAGAFDTASHVELKPHYLGNTLAFMFESSLVYRPTKWALETPALQKDYVSCWQGLKVHFKP